MSPVRELSFLPSETLRAVTPYPSVTHEGCDFSAQVSYSGFCSHFIYGYKDIFCFLESEGIYSYSQPQFIEHLLYARY